MEDDFQLNTVSGGWDRGQVLDEALLRQQRSDALFREYAEGGYVSTQLYYQLCHLRQSAASLFTYAQSM
jgi:hypothetical protein